jgi:hypothetical protein
LSHLVDPFSSRDILLSEPDKKNAHAAHDDSDEKIKDVSLRGVLCDAKATDLGILYFTCCLVIVGWFTIRSNHETALIEERAYISGGGSYINGGKDFLFRVNNYGKTPGAL